MKNIKLVFEDNSTMYVNEGKNNINLIEKIDSFYDELKVTKLNENEYKLWGFENEYQIFNKKTKELYTSPNQANVKLVILELEENEFKHILEIINKKENGSNNQEHI